ncbi:hypothetical protein [Paracoccus laeviglucosivorans]|uniref:Uncharacterized protein n=1 Tax=Paracoccus laeviglucosivorans TaxID=1197861 RepID=A0A521DHX9_9RHOB|nr:hypothetical protein [Paracoccus laeviglucosivorans]SMO70751.1 hypothetical protein SAMN06265221_10838 [Paracoccus laeviglucosivorans]
MQQHDLRPAAPNLPPNDGVVSDVLTSIRRLIAQDGRQLPGRPLHDRPLHDRALNPTGEGRMVLGRADMVAIPAGQDKRARDDAWQPAPIPDWPETDAAQQSADLGAVEVFPLPEDPDLLTPEEEAEFAEAEAALARMTTSPMAQPESFAPDPIAAPDTAPLHTAEQPDALAGNLFLQPDPDDDAKLRELVRGLIRAELQGDMGERISQNIRRLIRHEVESVIREICAEE